MQNSSSPSTVPSSQGAAVVAGTSVVATIVPPASGSSATASLLPGSQPSVGSQSSPVVSQPISGVTSGGGSSSGGILGALPQLSRIRWVPTLTSSTGLPRPSPTVTVTGGTAISSVAPVASQTMPIQSTSAALAGQQTTASASRLSIGGSSGMVVGEGLPPVPERLVTKMKNLDFFEMGELLPESWSVEEEPDRHRLMSWPRRRAKPVTEILQWVSCFSLMVGVLSKEYPVMVPELMAYQTTIIKCYKDFAGLHWVTYDRQYRRQAAVTKDWQWSKVNPTLYASCFTGRARRQALCEFCLSDSHQASDCPDNPSRLLLPVQLQLQSSGLGGVSQLPTASSLGNAPASHSTGGGKKLTSRICHLFNSGAACPYNPCKFAHICAVCRGPHPRTDCSKSRGAGGRFGGQGPKRPRFD